MPEQNDPEWPPKFSITPEGAAGMFLLQHELGDNATVDTQEALADLLKTYWLAGYDAAKEGKPRPD